MTPFKDAREFRKVFDVLFDTLSRDPRFGPALRARRLPQRYVIKDFGLVLNVHESDDKAAARGENLTWVWGDAECDWTPQVTLETTSEIFNRYFQGKENMPLALVRGRAHITQGSAISLLWMIPILHPFHEVWIEALRSRGWKKLVA